MEWTKTDTVLLIGSAIAVVAAGFLFPALGLTGSNVDSANIPEYNTTNAAWDYLESSNRPEFPSRPQQGTLVYIDNQSVYQDNRRVWLEGSTDGGGVEITLTRNGTLSDPEASLFLNEYNETSFVGADSTGMDNTSEFATLERAGYVVAFENVTFSNVGENNLKITTEWEIAETPTGASTLGSLPIVGDIYTSTAEAISGVIGVLSWGVSVLWYYVKAFSVTVVGVFIELYNGVTFLIDLFHWFLGGYSGLTSGATAGWASVILAIPGILFSVMFLKGGMIVISLLPTT